MAKKKRNPQDATLRNTRASRAQVKFLREWVQRLEARIEHLEEQVRRLSSKSDLSEDFATAQRRLGYKHSTAPRHQVRTTP